MKKILLIAALVLCALPSFGAIAFSHTGSATATSGTIAPSVTISSGETPVVLIVVHAAASRTITGVVDSSGANSYAQKVTAVSTNGTTVQTFIWSSLNVANSATSVTVTVSGTYTNTEVVVLTYTGVNAFGTTVQGTAASGTTPTVALVTQDANNFVVACLGQTAGSITLAFSANVGNLRRQQIAADNLRGTAGNDNTAASATTVTNTVTSNKSAAWASSALELRSGTAAATGAQVQIY